MRLQIIQQLTLLSYIIIYGVQGQEQDHQKLAPWSSEFWQCVFFCSILICLSGFCSGATQGLLSIDQMSLEMKKKNGTALEKQQADTILPVIEQHHLLLSTLLMSNATANESLPIFLHQLVPDWAAILVSAFFVVIFGEVVPSAFTTGPDQLQIAVKMIPYVKVLQSVLYIICYPLSLFLDWVLGIHEQQRYPIRDLRALIQLHVQVDHEGGETKHQKDSSINPVGLLSKEQLQLINSTIDLRDDYVSKQSIDISKVFMVSSEDKFSKEFIHKVRVKAFSRIPIYYGQDKQQIMGTFNAKSLLKYSEQDFGKSIAQLFQINCPLIVSKDTSMLQMLMIFQEKRKTLAFISDHHIKDNEDLQNINKLILNPKQGQFNIAAIICLNDVFEEMLDVQLVDEDIHGTLRNDPFDKRLDKQNSKRNGLGVINEGIINKRLFLIFFLEFNEGIERGLEMPLLKR